MDKTDSPKIYFLKDGLDPQMEICQYMSLNHFLCLIESKQYYVSRKYKFADIREKQLPLRNMFNIHEAKSDGYHSQPTEEQINNGLKQLDKKLRQYKLLNYLPTSCWTKNTKESAVLWNHFTPSLGVCIHSTIDRFVDSLSVDSEDIIGLDIEYRGYNHSMNVIECLSVKEGYFQHEDEIRFYFTSSKHRPGKNDTQPFIKIPIDINKLIDKIMLSPDISRIAALSRCSIFNEKYHLKASISKIEY